MDEYVPEEGSLSAALLAEVANGQARDLRVARARVADLEAENERLEAVGRNAAALLEQKGYDETADAVRRSLDNIAAARTDR
jgi:hypothetical protein